jgi:Tfp pilus assembly protein PilO
MAVTPTQKWYLAAGGASLAVLTAGWFLLVAPQQSSTAEITAQTDTVAGQNQTTENQIASLKQQFKNLPQLQTQVAAIRIKLPENPSEPALLRAISSLAKSSGVTLVSVQLAAPQLLTGGSTATTASTSAAGSVSLMPTNMEILGSYAQTKLFLVSLENMQRAILVTGLDMQRDSSDGGITSIRSTITARTFMASGGIIAGTSGAAGAPATTTTTPS